MYDARIPRLHYSMLPLEYAVVPADVAVRIRNDTQFIGPWRDTTLVNNVPVGPPSPREVAFDIPGFFLQENCCFRPRLGSWVQ